MRSIFSLVYFMLSRLFNTRAVLSIIVYTQWMVSENLLARENKLKTVLELIKVLYTKKFIFASLLRPKRPCIWTSIITMAENLNRKFQCILKVYRNESKSTRQRRNDTDNICSLYLTSCKQMT